MPLIPAEKAFDQLHYNPVYWAYMDSRRKHNVLYLLAFIISFPTLSQPASLMTTALSHGGWDRVQQILRADGEGTNFALLEREYQTLVNREVQEALMLVYAPENQTKLKITYASFTPESGDSGEDAGYGLHVVKRLVIDWPQQDTRTIDVNEAWAEDRNTGGLFLPDEIRVKVQVANGNRRTPGSQRLYLFDSLRLAWSETQQVTLRRRTHADPMRVPVTSPFSCLNCHHNRNPFFRQFLAPDESPNYEAIVQDSHFKLPLQQSKGFREYLAHLNSRGDVTPAFRHSVEASLLQPVNAMQVPGLFETLRRERNSMAWVTEDVPIEQIGHSYPQTGQGAYRTNHGWMIDVIDTVFEGKYRWWEPTIVIPKAP